MENEKLLPDQKETTTTNDEKTVDNLNIDWTVEHENILIEWADKAMCYRWLHAKANTLYANLNAWYTIPCIIISTLAGTANFAQQRVPEEYQGLFTMVVGGVNILGGIISTIQQFLKITQLNEAHRVSSISWDKFYRNVKIELAKHPNERIQVSHMLKMSKEEFDRLMETSPGIPEKITHAFKKSFSKSEEFSKIVKPEICDILIPTNNYRNQWSNEENKNKAINETIKLQISKENRIKRITEENNRIVIEFLKSFNNLNNREPMLSEVIDNLKDKVPVETITRIIENNLSSKNIQMISNL